MKNFAHMILGEDLCGLFIRASLIPRLRHHTRIFLQKLFPEYFKRKQLIYWENHLDVLHIETIDVCDAKCRFCPYTKKTRKNSFMDMDLFKRVVDEYVAMGGKWISLTPLVGDVLLDPRLIERAEYIKSKDPNLTVSFVTNGIKLHKFDTRRLMQSVDKIRVSLGGWTKQDYYDLYQVDEFEQVLLNLEQLFRTRSELQKSTRLILVFRVKEGDTQINNPEIVRLLDQYPEVEVQISDTYDTWGGNVPIQDMYDLKIEERGALNGPCARLYQDFQVLSNGHVVACACRDYEGNELYIGDLKNKSIKEIRRGPELEELKNRFLRHDYPDICKGCTVYKEL